MYNGRQVIKQGDGFGVERNAFASDEKMRTWTSAPCVGFDNFKNTMVSSLIFAVICYWTIQSCVWGWSEKNQGNGCTIKTPTPIPE